VIGAPRRAIARGVRRGCGRGGDVLDRAACAVAPPVHGVALVLGLRVSIMVAVATGAGCYSPTLRDCTVTCTAERDCGGGQRCGPDGFCAAPSIAGRCTTSDAATGSDGPGATSDAAVTADALCALGCTNGTCDGGVCVIDCSAPDSCPGTIACPPNIPCRVVCGDSACDRNVECRLATACEVACVGTNSCAEEIRCGLAPCTVTCSGDGACKRVKCKDACSCDATCSGEGACTDTTECPLGDPCRLGAGCSSQLAGCDRCL